MIGPSTDQFSVGIVGGVGAAIRGGEHPLCRNLTANSAMVGCPVTGTRLVLRWGWLVVVGAHPEAMVTDDHGEARLKRALISRLHPAPTITARAEVPQPPVLGRKGGAVTLYCAAHYGEKHLEAI